MRWLSMIGEAWISGPFATLTASRFASPKSCEGVEIFLKEFGKRSCHRLALTASSTRH